MNNLFVPEQEPQNVLFRLAVVAEKSGGGLKLKFSGEQRASQKAYRTLASCSASVGDRVLCASVSGTYVVLGVLAAN